MNADNDDDETSGAYPCQNVGCIMTFKYRIQRSRHKKVCKHLKPEEPFENVDNSFKCIKCSKVLKHSNNLKRHLKKCNGEQKNNTQPTQQHKCSTCDKVFMYKSKLIEHSKLHNRLSYKCSTCQRVFKREDHMHKHKCIAPSSTVVCATFAIPEDDQLPSMALIQPLNPTLEYDEATEDNGSEDLVFRSNLPSTSTYELPSPENNLSCSPNHLTQSSLFTICGAESTGNITLLDSSNSITTTPMRSITAFNEVGSEVATVTIVEHSTPETPKRTRQYRLSKQKCRKLDKVLQHIEITKALSVEERKEVLSKSLQDQEVVDQVDVKTRISDALMEYLKSLYSDKKYDEFYDLLSKIFPICDEPIQRHIAQFVGIKKYWRFSHKFQLHFQRKRGGRPKLDLSIRQTILDIYVLNSILTVDRRNGRDRAKLRKTDYIKLYEGLLLPAELTLENETNKRGVELVAVIKRVLTITLQSLQKKLFEKLGRGISIGTIHQNKPFFITYASEKEKVLCMCIICLNIREMFDALMNYVKKINPDLVESSITKYFMQGSSCEWVESGYWAKECCLGKCKDCKQNIQRPVLPISSNDAVNEIINYYQFEKVEHPYVNKHGEQKITKRCERVKHPDSPLILLEKLLQIRKKYLYHRYQIHQDKLLWPKILAANVPVFHMDFSENLQFAAKREAQSAHFNKVSTSLHCTVIHEQDEKGIVENKYVYHLSDSKTHDASYTFCVINDLISAFYPDLDIVRLKSDNCSTQYKSRHVFFRYKKLSMELGKTFIVYYGVSGHGKGLVDAMGGFGVKTPLRRAILINEKLFYESHEMVTYLDSVSSNDNWFYLLVDDKTLAEEREEKREFVVNGCEAQHMMAYLSNGVVSMKQNLCICAHCEKGYLYRCEIEPGRIVSGKDVVNQKEEEEEEEKEEEEEDGELEGDDVLINEDCEQNEMPHETYFDIVNIDSYVAIYCDDDFSKINEHFYLGKVLGKGKAAAIERDCMTIYDDWGHPIEVGENYITIHYLEKDESKGKRGKVCYKELNNKKIYVLPGEIFYPCVPMNPDCTLDIGDYQFLCDCLSPRR